MNQLTQITADLRDAVDRLSFAAPTTHVYNPLRYAWDAQAEYLARFGGQTGRTVMLGMNPGPFGMVQTGVPFGEVSLVRDWIGIQASIGRPEHEHPKRPVLGFDCKRTEVSGKRLWGWARDRYETPERFFEQFFVLNYCPLVFMEDTGRNRTPDKLSKAEREALYQVCDDALVAAIAALKPGQLIGIGKFAVDRLKGVLPDTDIPIITAPHPSPASPIANRGWAPLMDQVVDSLSL